MDEELELALLNAVWISRWNSDKTALSAVLTTDEAYNICKDILTELNNSGFKIVRKNIESNLDK